ncbi:MAG TPA: hypothetical protein VFK06_02550 [Candidatus Angelobacter sp.]|nr:hypothetical protein [Candidatus Angelobacter sp.]
MTTTSQRNSLSKRQVLALRGLRLPSPALKQLREAGIYCEPAISIEYLHLAKRYVIWGRESGGAIARLGAYCGYVGTGGEPLDWLARVNSVGRNGVHATVIAPRLMRIHAFRNEGNCEVLITRHELIAREIGRRPTLENHIVFHGVNGAVVAGALLPEFRSRVGELISVPGLFREAVKNAVAGAYTVGCCGPRLLLPPSKGADQVTDEGTSYAG